MGMAALEGGNGLQQGLMGITPGMLGLPPGFFGMADGSGMQGLTEEQVASMAGIGMTPEGALHGAGLQVMHLDAV